MALRVSARMFVAGILGVMAMTLQAQQYDGMSGLIHVPSAEMDTCGQIRIGGHFLNRHDTPKRGFVSNKERYDTGNVYLSITPFKWVEIGYSMTLMKVHDIDDNHLYWGKDRHFSVKFQPLAERPGKWWPSVAFGGQDAISSSFDWEQLSGYFMNVYLVASKHYTWHNHTLGATLGYRYYTKKFNKRWQGVIGGLTYRPAFARNFRVILEYAGHGQMDLGVDCILWKHLMLQASLNRFKHFNGGLCYTMNLF